MHCFMFGVRRSCLPAAGGPPLLRRMHRYKDDGYSETFPGKLGIKVYAVKAGARLLRAGKLPHSTNRRHAKSGARKAKRPDLVQ